MGNSRNPQERGRQFWVDSLVKECRTSRISLSVHQEWHRRTPEARVPCYLCPKRDGRGDFLKTIYYVVEEIEPLGSEKEVIIL